MTFLELCQRLRQEAGIAGTGPSTVVSQLGELGRIVDWVSTADEDIQNLYNTWKFLQTEFSFSTVSGTQNYTKSDLSLTDLLSWKTDDIRVYLAYADEQYLTYIPWEDFRELYLFGSSRSQEERPTVFSIKPDDSISLWPTPDAVYTINGEYFKKAQTMTANDHTPLIPSSYQMAIVWRGLMLLGAYSGENDLYMHGQNEYKAILRKLKFSQLPRMQFGAPLA